MSFQLPRSTALVTGDSMMMSKVAVISTGALAGALAGTDLMEVASIQLITFLDQSGEVDDCESG